MPELRLRNIVPLYHKSKARGNDSSVLHVCGAFLHGFLHLGDALACSPEGVGLKS